MRTSSLLMAALAAAVIGLGVRWAVDSEAAAAGPEQIGQIDGQRYSLLSPTDYGDLAACAVCHRLDARGGERSAPTLFGIVGADKARAGWFGYSPALARAEGRWSEQALAEYIENPTAYLPGTAKVLSPIRDPERRQRIIEALAKLH